MSTFNNTKEISEATKKNVMTRQGGRSVSGAYLTEKTASFHHYIARSASGVGYEWNIVALTFDEHRAVHDHQPIKVNGKVRYTWEEFHTLMHNHLALRYRNWSEDKCKYKKRLTEEEYGIERNYKPNGNYYY